MSCSRTPRDPEDKDFIEEKGEQGEGMIMTPTWIDGDPQLRARVDARSEALKCIRDEANDFPEAVITGGWCSDSRVGGLNCMRRETRNRWIISYIRNSLRGSR